MLERLSITSKEYFALVLASNSGIKEAYEMFQASGLGVFDTTKVYRFGSAVDALSTEPDELNLTDMTSLEISLLMPMRRALEDNQIFKALFKNVEGQLVFIDKEFYVEVDGLKLLVPAKCKYDFWNAKFNFGGDLKSTFAKSQQQFDSACEHFQYYRQAAWYMDITKTNRFVIIGVSKHNFKTFVISIKRDDERYLKGKEQYSNYATYWWKLNGGSLAA